MRCEIQAIDQHWALHRLALSLPSGAIDETLARDIALADLDPKPAQPIAWPAVTPNQVTQVLSAALEQELSEELGELRARQEKHLRRELDRVDDYFENYSSELTRRAARSPSIKMTERLETAKQEHQRHRSDQIARHEITIKPQIDTLLLVAEPAWRTRLSITHAHDTQEQEAHFIPRSRRWERIS